MAGIRFIKLPRHRQFDYTPRHWNPEKEAREERVKRIRQEMGSDDAKGPERSTIRRGAFRDAKMKNKVKANRSSNIRLVVILAILFLISYLIFIR